MPRRLTIPTLLPPLILLLLPTLLLWRVVFAGDVFLPADLLRDIAPWRSADPTRLVPWNPLMWDSMAEFYPWRLFAAQTLRAGWLPLWNPHQFCGTPFVANSQSAVFYPFNLVFCLMPVARAFGVSVWLHLALTGLFLFGFLRSGAFRLSPPAALLGAIAWQMSAWQVSWLALPTFLCVSCWMPLALWLTWRAIDSAEVRRWMALGACLGLMVLAGHLQIALYGIGLTIAYALFLLWPQRRLPVGLAIALVIMLGLAAPQLLPTFELAWVSHRAGTPVTWQSYGHYTALALPWLNLVTLFLPGFFGNPTQGTYWGVMTNGGPSGYMENACYIGILALALALLGVAATWQQRQTRFFTVAALVGLLLALGTPLDALLYFGLPGFSQSGSPGRVLVVWTLCAAILAATGAEALVTAPARQLLRPGGLFLAAFLAAAGGTLLWIVHSGRGVALAYNLPRVGDLWRVPAGVLLGAAALLWLRRRGTLQAPAAGLLLAVLAATDLLAAGWGYNRTASTDQVYPVTPIITALQRGAGDGRVLFLNHGWSIEANRPPPALLPPNGATAYGLDDIAGYDSLLTRRSFQFVAALDDGRSPAPPENGNMVLTSDYRTPEAEAANARYIVAPVPLADPTLQLIAQDGPVSLYENPHRLPRARVTPGNTELPVQDISPTRVEITLPATPPGDITLADQWYPGWQARRGQWNGGGPHLKMALTENMFRKVTERTNGNAAGGQRIEMHYQPAAFRTGLYGLCLTLAALTAVMASGLARRLSGGRRG